VLCLITAGLVTIEHLFLSKNTERELGNPVLYLFLSKLNITNYKT
jgi:hypothetical protein